MTEEYVLVASTPGQTEEVLAWLRTLPGIREVRRVHYGHFDILVQLAGPSHVAIQELVANKLRFHVGVPRVDELGEADDAEVVLRAVELGDT